MDATVTGWGCYPSRLNDWGCQGKPVFTAGQDFCHNSFRIGDKNTQTSGLDGGVGVGGVWGWKVRWREQMCWGQQTGVTNLLDIPVVHLPLYQQVDTGVQTSVVYHQPPR